MILLKPGEFDSGELDMAVSSKAKAGSLTFQMGFNLKGDEQDQIDIKSKDILWSNPITIEVNNAMLKNAWPAQ